VKKKKRSMFLSPEEKRRGKHHQVVSFRASLLAMVPERGKGVLGCSSTKNGQTSSHALKLFYAFIIEEEGGRKCLIFGDLGRRHQKRGGELRRVILV